MGADRELLVLAWTEHWFGPDYLAPRTVTGVDGSPVHLRFSTDEADLARADAVWFHAPQMRPLPPRRTGQPWVLMSMESEVHVPLPWSDVGRLFDLHMTYRLDADVPTPYASWREHPGLRAPTERPPQRRERGGASVLYLASNPVPERDRLVAELMDQVAVDSAGRCLTNVDVDELLGPEPVDDAEQARRLVARYPLVLAFENSRCEDYATEKLYRALALGSVPVTWGAPNVRELVPDPRAVIDVDDFATVAALGAHLRHLHEHPEDLTPHLAWRTEPMAPGFRALVDVGDVEPMDRLARKLAHGCDHDCPCGGRLRTPTSR